MKQFLVWMMVCGCFATICMADDDFDLLAKSYQSDLNHRPGPRHDFAWAFRYNPSGEKNHIYVTGGIDGNGCLKTYLSETSFAASNLTRVPTEWPITIC